MDTRRRLLSILAAVPLFLGSGEGRAQEEVQATGTRLEGEVRSGDVAREGLRVRVTTEAGEVFVASTDARGGFRIDGLPRGPATLECLLSREVTYSTCIDVPEGRSFRHDVRQALGTARISGVVKGGELSSVERSRIDAWPIDCEKERAGFAFRTFSREMGEFDFVGLPEGRYLLSTTFRRKAAVEDPLPDGEERPAVAEIDVVSGTDHEVTLRPRLGNAILWLVPDPGDEMPYCVHLLLEEEEVPTGRQAQTLLEGPPVRGVLTKIVDEGHEPRRLDLLPPGRYHAVLSLGELAPLLPPDEEATLPSVLIELKERAATRLFLHRDGTLHTERVEEAEGRVEEAERTAGPGGDGR